MKSVGNFLWIRPGFDPLFVFDHRPVWTFPDLLEETFEAGPFPLPIFCANLCWPNLTCFRNNNQVFNVFHWKGRREKLL